MRRLFLVSLLLPVLGGCSNQPYKVASVSGTVKVNGKPLPNAAVVFSPIAEGTINPGPDAGAKTDAQGHYALTITMPSGKQIKGAVVGKHKVRITLIQEQDSADDRVRRFKQLPAKYNGKDTILECEVPSQGKEDADFNLTVP
jgi:hypothetical protein